MSRKYPNPYPSKCTYNNWFYCSNNSQLNHVCIGCHSFRSSHYFARGNVKWITLNTASCYFQETANRPRQTLKTSRIFGGVMFLLLSLIKPLSFWYSPPPLEYQAMIADSREINWFLDVWSRDFFYKHVVTSYTYQDTWWRPLRWTTLKFTMQCNIDKGFIYLFL